MNSHFFFLGNWAGREGTKKAVGTCHIKEFKLCSIGKKKMLKILKQRDDSITFIF